MNQYTNKEIIWNINAFGELPNTQRLVAKAVYTRLVQCLHDTNKRSNGRSLDKQLGYA